MDISGAIDDAAYSWSSAEDSGGRCQAASVVINPGTPVEAIKNVLNLVDQV